MGLSRLAPLCWEMKTGIFVFLPERVVLHVEEEDAGPNTLGPPEEMQLDLKGPSLSLS